MDVKQFEFHAVWSSGRFSWIFKSILTIHGVNLRRCVWLSVVIISVLMLDKVANIWQGDSENVKIPSNMFLMLHITNIFTYQNTN